MNKRAYRKNIIKLIVIALIAIIIVAAFLFIGVKFHNHKLLRYAMKLRIPKVIAMIITAFAAWCFSHACGWCAGAARDPH